MTAILFSCSLGDHHIDNIRPTREHGEAEAPSEVKQAVQLHQHSMIMPHGFLTHLAGSRQLQTLEPLPHPDKDQQEPHGRLISLAHKVLIEERWDLVTRMECIRKILG